MSPTIDSPKFIDLFAGCGGLSLGLEQAGFFPLFVNELNSDAMETYLKNRDAQFPHLRKRFHANDIKSIVSDKDFFNRLFSDLSSQFGQQIKVGEIDLVTGGPPCQGFSGIGIRRSYSVDKSQLPSNHLFQDMAYFIHNIRPKIFLFENVEGLLRSRWTKDGIKGEAFRDVLKTFNSLEGYNVKHKLIHAKDYAVPQNRPRVLLIGVRDDLTKSDTSGDDAVLAGFLPPPIGMYPHLIDVLSDLVDPTFEYGGKTLKYVNTANSKWQKEIRTLPNGQILKKGSRLTDQEYSKHSPSVRARFQAMIENGGIIPPEMKTKKFAQRLLPERWGNKGPSITACSLADDFVHFAQPRSLTVREWARLQTFPDWYEFAGKRTTGGIRRAGNPRENIFDREVPKYTQIGNAVPPRLGLEVGKHILRILGHN
jgi:DNA (cytosine-5)-methyltransferase 1